MPLPTAADCWPVVADRRPSPLAPRCRPPWRAGHLSEVRGAKITAFSVPTNFSLRNLSPARRVITAEGTAAAEGHRRPKALPPNGPPPGSPQNRRTPAAAEASRPEGHHRRMARRPEARRIAALPLPRRHCSPEDRRRRDRPPSGIASGGASHFCSRPSKLPDRRSCPLSRQTVEAARYRSGPSRLPAIAADRRTGG